MQYIFKTLLIVFVFTNCANRSPENNKVEKTSQNEIITSDTTSPSELTLTDPVSGLKVLVINKDFPLLKILLPGQPVSERGIETEFPEHVTGLNEQTNNVEHLYFNSYGDRNKRTLPSWRIDNNVLIYESLLNGNIKMIAKAELNTDGIKYSYSFTNNSTTSYKKIQAVTCVKLYSSFSDTLLQRTYVHHSNGFDLLASETPDRLSMPLDKWLPCRYLVSYTWDVPAKLIEKDEDGITRYNKSRKVDKPVIATLSHDKKWVAATYTSETGNLWTNPERSCQHADPAVDLKSGATQTLRLGTYIFRGTLDNLLGKINSGQKSSL